MDIVKLVNMKIVVATIFRVMKKINAFKDSCRKVEFNFRRI